MQKTIDPNKIDPQAAMKALNTLSKAMAGFANDMGGGIKVEDVFKTMTIKKSYPVVVNGKRGNINVLANNEMSIKIEGITEQEIKNLIKKIHD